MSASQTTENGVGIGVGSGGSAGVGSGVADTCAGCKVGCACGNAGVATQAEQSAKNAAASTSKNPKFRFPIFAILA